MQHKLGSREEVCLHGAGCSTVYLLSGEKADCSIPQCVLWGKASAQRAEQVVTANAEASQKRVNRKPFELSRDAQQRAGFFSAQR